MYLCDILTKQSCSAPENDPGRIGNRVRIANGTAAVSAYGNGLRQQPAIGDDLRRPVLSGWGRPRKA